MIISCIGPDKTKLSESQKTKLTETIKNILIESNYNCRFNLCFRSEFSDYCLEIIRALGGKRLSVQSMFYFTETPQNSLDGISENFGKDYYVKKRNDKMINDSDAAIFFDTENEIIKESFERAEKAKKTVYKIF